MWTSGAGKAREPVGGAHAHQHRDAHHCGDGVVVERAPSKSVAGPGSGPGPKALRLTSAPPFAQGVGEGVVLQDLADGVSALALGREQS